MNTTELDGHGQNACMQHFHLNNNKCHAESVPGKISLRQCLKTTCDQLEGQALPTWSMQVTNTQATHGNPLGKKLAEHTDTAVRYG